MTKNNWFTTNLSERSLQNLCEFQIDLSPYEFVEDSFSNNSKRVASELYDEFGKLYLAYSGGIDSEYVLKTFKELDIPITPVIVETPYNNYESTWALDYCKEINIKPEIIHYEKDDFIEQLYAKTISEGRFSLLGGVPLLVCDAVNDVGGKLLTGYGDPFSISHTGPTILSETLEFSEWDYYLDSYDSSHPSGFFTYDLSLFHSFISQINYKQTTQGAKIEMYQVRPRPKMFWQKEFYARFREMTLDVTYNEFIHKNTVLENLNRYTGGTNKWPK